MFKNKKTYYATFTPGIIYSYSAIGYRTVLTMLSEKRGCKTVCV